MSVIEMLYDVEKQYADISLDGSGSFTRDKGFRTAIVISWFTDGLAGPGDVIAVGDPDDRRGWWGDSFPEVEGDLIGSRLWLDRRGKINDETVQRQRRLAREALQWMIDDGAARRITVIAERTGSQISLRAEPFRPNEQNLRFEDEWEAEINGIV